MVSCVRFIPATVLTVALLVLSAASAQASATAVATCAPCLASPCVDYCATPPCPPCSGEEGDSFIFYSGNSTGTNLIYLWKFDDTIWHQLGSSTVTTYQFRRPHNAVVNPNGWPVELKVVSNENPSGLIATVPVSIANVAPTAIAYGRDIANQKQYQHIVVYAGFTRQFFCTESYDRASNAGIGNGIARCDWDPNYDGTSFNAVFNGEEPWRTWANPGTYTLRLRVKDDDDPFAYGYVNMTVEAIPDGPFARIVAPADPFSEGETVRFDGNSSGTRQGVTSWKWDFDYNGTTFTEQASGQTAYHAFGDARPYTVALLVSDSSNRTFLNTTTVTPTNLSPMAAAQLRLPGGAVLTPPYTVNEGVSVTFDGSPSAVVPPDPGQVVSWEWDFNFSDPPGFNPVSSTQIATHVFRMDTAEMGGQPYTVRLRVTDDDNAPGRVSQGFTNISVTVLDVPPQASIHRCTTSSYATCAAPTPPVRLSQNEAGYFKAMDISTNQDYITSYEWDTAYTGVFIPNPAFTNQQRVAVSWLAISTPTLALRITDDDGQVSIATLQVEIVDLPPRAVISPSGDDGVLTLNEGQSVVFDASATQIVPGDKLTLLSWDWSTQPGLFTPDTGETAHTCQSGFCSEAGWLSCTGGAPPGNTCPVGPGSVTRSYPKGPSEEWLVLCVEDLDDTGVCVAGADPAASATARQFTTVRVVVQNVPPAFNPDDPHNPLVPEVTRGQTFSWCPTVVEPGADTLTFDCNPEKLPVGMECNTQSGCLSWTPGADAVSCDEGDNPQSLTLTVCDDAGACDTLDTVLTVLYQNAPPVIQGFAGAPSTPAGELYRAEILATDPDSACEDYPSYYLCGSVQTGMSIDLNGVFTWTPSVGQVGAYVIGLCVRDQHTPEDCSVCLYHNLSVVDPGSMPRITAGEDVETDPGVVCLRGKLLDNPGGYELDFAWEQADGPAYLCLFEDPDVGEDPSICLIAQTAGDYVLTLEADTGSYRVQDRVTVTVRELPPVAHVTGPRHYPLGAFVELDARASADPNGAPLTYFWTDPYEVLESVTLALTGFRSVAGIPPGQGVAAFLLDVADDAQAGETLHVETELLLLDEDGKVEDAAPHAVIDPPLTYLVLGESVELSGQASDTRPPGGTLTYEWTREDGSPLVPDSETPEVLVVKPAQAGTQRIYLTVYDGERPSRAAAATLVTRPGAAPVAASAGPDQIATLDAICTIGVRNLVLVTLDGSASQLGEDPATECVWTQTAGLPAGLAQGEGCLAEAALMSVGLHEFTVSIMRGDELLARDSSWVAVSPAGKHGVSLVLEAPRWDEERRLAFVDPGLTAFLDASASVHEDAKTLTFHWTQRFGPAQGVEDWSSPQIAFTPDLPGQAVGLRLWATGPTGAPSLPLDLTVVALSRANLPPVCVVAEAALSAVPGEWVSLDASGSYDSNDDAIAFLWRQRLGESDGVLEIRDSETEIAQVASDVGGVFVFEAVVSDEFERCISTPVVVTITPNRPPVADAGGDRRMCLGETVVLDGTASADPDGHELAYRWRIVDDDDTGMLDSDFVPDAEAPAPSLSPINPGVMRIELVVSDGFEGGESDPDVMTLTITSRCEDGDEDTDDDTPVLPDGDQDEEEESGGGGGCSCRQQSPGGPFALVLVLVLLWGLRFARLREKETTRPGR